MRAQYQAIKDYGLIGNLRWAALVGMDGSIDRTFHRQRCDK